MKNHNLSSSSYKNAKTPIWIVHNKCGYRRFITPYTAVVEHGRCPLCTAEKYGSCGERIIRQFLNRRHIPYIYGYIIHSHDCRYNHLHLDFYLYTLNKAIEYDGYQHKYLVNWTGNMSFHDQLVAWERETTNAQWKETWCKIHHIDLYRIKDYNDIAREDKYSFLNKLKQMFSNYIVITKKNGFSTISE